MSIFRSAMALTALIAATPLVAAGTTTAAEIEYPHDTVMLITHSSPGGGSDVFLRTMAKQLGPIMGVDFVVENIEGGSSAQAMAKLATSPADGSILYATTPTFINTSILSSPRYTYEDLDPLVNVFLDPQVIYTRGDSPFDTLRAAIDYAKAHPGEQKWGVSTPGSLDRQVMEKLKALTGLEVIVVTHPGGGDLLLDVLNGTVDLGVGEIQELRGQIEAGDVKLLATYTEERLADFPDVATAREQGVDLVVSKFRGLASPQGLPDDVVAAWEEAIPLVLEDPEFMKFYRESSLVPTFMPHGEYVEFIRDFAEEQKQFMRQYNIIAEE